MDSRIGLDFIVENPEYIRKLAAALDTTNNTVKKQVFELLSALCVYNEEGHARALETLAQYKKLKNERFRLSVIVKELDRTTVVEYQTTLVAFINCIIISTYRLPDRIRLRNEFVGCHLLPVLNNLRKCAEAEPELAVQLDVFDEQRDSDETQSLQGPHGVDLSSPLDVFYAILKQVTETPQEVIFLAILQHLLRIDNRDSISNTVWDTAERLVHRATLLESHDQASHLLRTPSTIVSSSANRNTCVSSVQCCDTSVHWPSADVVPPPPPPPPPMPSSLSLPPPAPPIAHPYQFHGVLSAATIGAQRVIVTTPPSDGVPHNLETLRQPQPLSAVKLPQQEIPQPKIKMKTFNWNKIPSNKVVGKDCIWQQVACSHQKSPMAEMDWQEMEGLFCQQIATPSAHSSPKLGNRVGSNDTVDRRMRKDNSEITLLDGKRSLNVNIFLKQFRSSTADIVQLIRNGVHDDIGAEKLKGLLKILPEVDELDVLKLFDGDFNRLGNAEKFLIQLTSLPKYKLRIECMLLKEEFAANMSYLEPSINSMINAAEDLMTSKPLKEVLYMILVAGNFLNAGGYAGDAAGVKLSSLQKITDIRANKPNMNLIHYVAIQAEKKNKDLLTFTDNISVLEDAAKTTVEQLQNELIALDVRISKIRKEIDNPATESDIKRQMSDFLLVAEREVGNVQRVMVHLEDVRRRLADFFCDDTATFKLEECFRVFHGFYCKWRQAVAENDRRRTHEEQVVARRRQREELLAAKRRQMGSISAPNSDSHHMDTQIFDGKTGFPIKKGKRNPSGGNLTSEEEISIAGSPSMTRRRLGSFNGGQNSDCGSALDRTTPLNGKDDRSPELTPNGSLRRRRSRVLSEEDEGNLMEFLRASGHDNNRERKSWGSLDRSWAQRARGLSSRKRPALLTPDSSSCVPIYQGDQRSNSPRSIFIPDSSSANAAVTSESPANVGEPPRPREWRQKIESWLKANESGSGSPATVCADRDQSIIDRKNRRSLELDSESDRSNTLDTLPEGKQVYSDSQTSYRRSYPDWKPSHAIDNTDVVSAMETVEEVQAPYVKDKSAWRKSNLNVANSAESTRPRDINNTAADNDVQQQQQRKELISTLGQRPVNDRLTVYIRRPSNDTFDTSPVELTNTPISTDNITSNKDIDQDNIETPPATRRIFIPTPTEKREPTQPSPCKRMLNRTNNDPILEHGTPPLGDGQFDRFSATRRTRRFKRNTDTTDANAPVCGSVPIVGVDAAQGVATGATTGCVLGMVGAQEMVKRPRKSGHGVVGVGVDCIENGGSVNNDEGFEEAQSDGSPSRGDNGPGRDGKCANDGDGGKQQLVADAAQPQLSSRFNRSNHVRKTTQEQSSKKPTCPSTITSSTVKRTNSLRRPISASEHTILSPRRAIHTTGNTATNTTLRTISRNTLVPTANATIMTAARRCSTLTPSSGIGRTKSTNAHIQRPLSAPRASVSTLGLLNAAPVAAQHSSAKVTSSNREDAIGSSSNSRQHAVRSNGLSFMKPTASSTTKTTTATVLPSRLHSSFKLKY